MLGFIMVSIGITLVKSPKIKIKEKTAIDRELCLSSSGTKSR